MSRSRAGLLAGLLALSACDAPPPEGPDDAEVLEVFQALHPAIYDVYDLGTDRDALHDLLASRFTGEALTAEYVEHYATAVGLQARDASVSVLGVRYGDLAVLQDRGDGVVRVDATWWVRGIVRHARHKHPRVNQYRAVYELVDTPEGWRIGATHMRDLARVRTSSPGTDVFDEGPDDEPVEARGFMDPVELLDLLGDTDAPTDGDAADPEGGP